MSCLLEGACAASYNEVMSMNQQQMVDLVRRIRHDANNPLTAALGHVQLLLDDPTVSDPEARESLQIIESELRRLTEILRQLNEIKIA